MERAEQVQAELSACLEGERSAREEVTREIESLQTLTSISANKGKSFDEVTKLLSDACTCKKWVCT